MSREENYKDYDFYDALPIKVSIKVGDQEFRKDVMIDEMTIKLMLVDDQSFYLRDAVADVQYYALKEFNRIVSDLRKDANITLAKMFCKSIANYERTIKNEIDNDN